MSPELPAPTTAAGREGLAAIQSSPHTSLAALDYDGTLSAISQRPEDAIPVPGALDAVGLLAERVGALVLSEFAGAAAQLKNGALLVNPHDIEGMADALKAAFEMPPAERLRRMHAMQELLRKEDIFWWLDRYLKAALGSVPDDFRTPKEILPPADAENWVEI